MIVENQTNIKCHLATTEIIEQGIAALASGSNYNLGTAFPFAYELFKKGKINPNNLGIIKKIAENSSHYILDSGLFTLMFGSLKGKKDEAYIERWYESLVEFIKLEGYTGTIVEVDCQKVLGPEKAWELRERMKKDLNNRIINVFHLEDGKNGLDRLIEYSDYIALSIPELRFNKKKNHMKNLALYVKNKKPSIDIHLLGFTEEKALYDFKFCTSCDSSSWIAPLLYGHFKNTHIKNIKEEIIKKCSIEWEKCRDKTFPTLKTSNKKRLGLFTLFASEHLKQYTKQCGSQK